MINGTPSKHFVYSLDVDTCATNPGWPVDVNATASYNGINFVSFAQEERGGLALVMKLCTYLTLATWVTVTFITVGLSVLISIILLRATLLGGADTLARVLRARG